jgi:hypothetical protein
MFMKIDELLCRILRPVDKYMFNIIWKKKVSGNIPVPKGETS